MRDLKSNLNVAQSIAPTGNRKTSTDGTGIDLQGYDGALVVITADTVTDGTHTPAVEESSDNSTFTAVAAGDLVGTALVAITADSVQRVSYIGTKRYIRVTVAVTGSPATGGKYAAVVVRGCPARGAL